MQTLDTRYKENDASVGESGVKPTRPQASSPVAILGRTLRTLYLLAAVLYTFWHLITTSSPWQIPSPSHKSAASSSSTVLDAVANAASASLPHAGEAPVLSWAEWGRIHGVEWNKDVITWEEPGATSQAFAMSEDYFLSKAFGESLQPSKVIPYYYRATNDVPKEDITITTLVTSDRFKVLAALVQRYRGAPFLTLA